MSKWSANEAGVVLGGYDVVAYLEQSEAVRGSAQHAVENGGLQMSKQALTGLLLG